MVWDQLCVSWLKRQSFLKKRHFDYHFYFTTIVTVKCGPRIRKQMPSRTRAASDFSVTPRLQECELKAIPVCLLLSGSSGLISRPPLSFYFVRLEASSHFIHHTSMITASFRLPSGLRSSFILPVSLPLPLSLLLNPHPPTVPRLSLHHAVP